MNHEPDQPLNNESAARTKWRGDEDAPKPDAPGHTLPASEDRDEEADGNAGSAGLAGPGAILPPD